MKIFTGYKLVKQLDLSIRKQQKKAILLLLLTKLVEVLIVQILIWSLSIVYLVTNHLLRVTIILKLIRELQTQRQKQEVA